jgi:predicted ATP-dependent serine protease
LEDGRGKLRGEERGDGFNEDDLLDEGFERLVDGEGESARLQDVPDEGDDGPILRTGVEGLDRLLSPTGGMRRPSVVLLGGGPGAGKSTLAACAASRIGRSGGRVLYASAEETMRQCRRLFSSFELSTKGIDVRAGGPVEGCLEQLESKRYDLLVLDSAMAYEVEGYFGFSDVGRLKRFASLVYRSVHAAEACAIVICHITKSGAVAGPQFLQHAFDATLFLQKEELEGIETGRILLKSRGKVRGMSTSGLSAVSVLRMGPHGFLSEGSAEDGPPEKPNAPGGRHARRAPRRGVS